MSRKSLILCLSALAVMILGIGIAVAVLYSGTGSSGKAGGMKVADSECGLLLSAVPSDAVLVVTYSEKELFPAAGKTPVAMSCHHYSGKLNRLYVLQVSDPAQIQALTSSAEAAGFFVSQEAGLLLLSDTETLLKSSQRHISKGISILDAAGFADAMTAVRGDDILYVSNTHMDRLLPILMPRPYSGYSGFMERLADWSVFDLEWSDECTSLCGTLMHDSDASAFMNVLDAMTPSVSAVSQVLPSYTIFAASLQMKDMDAYLDAYKSYLDSRQKLQIYLSDQKAFGEVSPLDLLRKWEVSEVAVASFKSGSVTETVNLMRVEAPEVASLFKGTDVTSLKGYQAQVHHWAYPSLLAGVFGDFFARKDESAFTYVDGWVVTGSHAGVEEYATGRALEYNLKQCMADAGEKDLLAGRASSFVAYFSFTEDRAGLQSIFKKNMLSDLKEECAGAEYCPFVLSVAPGKKTPSVNIDLFRLTLRKTKAPAFERDTVVVVPKGPFEVKNSGTGKMNRFYQNSHNSLCLSQDGKDLWGVSFDKPLCGRAGTVDFFANGKLQILFCAGDKLYLIDRLGRYVKGFPLTLDKEVLLGPDIYDFNGTRKYNVMVLHKDNTVQMYNLKGQKPASWKGITATETIKNLPERLVVGGSTFWVVRTSIQTLIYPFYGGEPLTAFTGDQMIRPDSQVRAVDGTTVEFTCYDGKVRTAALK